MAIPSQISNRFRLFVLTLVLVSPLLIHNTVQSQTTITLNEESSDATRAVKSKLDEVVIESFLATHDGWSSDEVILNDELNAAYILECQKRLPESSASELNWRLINLRKAGKLSQRSTDGKRSTTKSKRTNVSDVLHIAEIAARNIHDQHSISTDQIMADPEYRSAFNQLALSVDPEVDLYRVRKAAFNLRKNRRLRPELITRIADWGREVNSFSIKQLVDAPELVKPNPGIYIFRDKTGYLYIGQTENLRTRLQSHLEKSHNLFLSGYLTKNLSDENSETITIEIHSFDKESQAKKTMVRRAYESELIASRKPRFNIQP